MLDSILSKFSYTFVRTASSCYNIVCDMKVIPCNTAGLSSSLQLELIPAKDRPEQWKGLDQPLVIPAAMLSTKEAFAKEGSFVGKMMSSEFDGQGLNPLLDLAPQQQQQQQPTNGFSSGPPSMEMICVKVSLKSHKQNLSDAVSFSFFLIPF